MRNLVPKMLLVFYLFPLCIFLKPQLNADLVYKELNFSDGENSLEKKLHSFFCEGEKFQKAHVGISVLDLSTGEEIYQHNQDKFFITASLAKIPLSYAVLTLLGKDFCYKTRLEYDGSIDPLGTLNGNLWIRASGDPNLSIEDVLKWAHALHKKGIKWIKGKINLDLSGYETLSASPYWNYGDIGNYYGAGAFGININKNLYEVTFQPGAKEGDAATVVDIQPSIPGLVFYNEVTTGPKDSGDQVVVYGSEYCFSQYYRGTVPLGVPLFTIKAAIPDPPFFCGSLLAKELQPSDGIEIIRGKNTPNAPTIFLTEHTSLPIKELILEMNTMSINLFAEHFLKTIGQGKIENGIKKVERLFHDLEIPCQIRDGSGLARTNYLTPKGLVKLLSKIYHELPYHVEIYHSFPEPQKKGTLQFFPVISGAKLKAKTGSLSDVFNLGGYLQLASGREFAFAIFCNCYSGPIQEIKEEMARFLEMLAKLNL